jgi:hypothetical protein
MSEGDDLNRCTDQKLFQLCKDFKEHQARFERHEERETATFGRILDAQHENTKAIGDLTGQITSLVTETRASVQLTRDLEGITRVGGGVQKFVLWCLKWGGILGGLGVGISWIIDHFSRNPVG